MGSLTNLNNLTYYDDCVVNQEPSYLVNRVYDNPDPEQQSDSTNYTDSESYLQDGYSIEDENNSRLDQLGKSFEKRFSTVSNGTRKLTNMSSTKLKNSESLTIDNEVENRRLSIQMQLVDIINSKMITGEDMRRASVAVNRPSNVDLLKDVNNRSSNLNLNTGLKREDRPVSSKTRENESARNSKMAAIANQVAKRNSIIQALDPTVDGKIGLRRTSFVPGLNVEVYDYSKLSRASVSKPQTALDKNPKKSVANLLLHRVASDPEISSEITANIILPQIDIRELLNTTPGTAVDCIGGVPLPKLDFGKMGLSPRHSPPSHKGGSFTPNKKRTSLKGRANSKHLQDPISARNSNHGGTRSCSKTSMGERRSTNNNRSYSVSRSRINSTASIGSRISLKSVQSNCSEDVYGTYDDKSKCSIMFTAKNMVLICIILASLFLASNPTTWFQSILGSYWLRIPAIVFLIIEIIVNWRFFHEMLEFIFLFETQKNNDRGKNSVAPTRAANELKTHRLDMRKNSATQYNNQSKDRKDRDKIKRPAQRAMSNASMRGAMKQMAK